MVKKLEELKNYTLESKLELCRQKCSTLYDANGLLYQNNQNKLNFFTVENFVVYSLLYNDPNEKNIITIDIFDEFISIIFSMMVKEFESMKLNPKPSDPLTTIKSNQFPVQRSFFVKLYRYNYFYNFINNNINMKTEFFNFFGNEFNDFSTFAFLKAIEQCGQNNEIIPYIKNKYLDMLENSQHLINKLKISYFDFVKNEKEHNEINNTYYYGIKTQYSYPYIEYKQALFLPTPYLLINAVTEGFFNRLTFENDNLRD